MIMKTLIFIPIQPYDSRAQASIIYSRQQCIIDRFPSHVRFDHDDRELSVLVEGLD